MKKLRYFLIIFLILLIPSSSLAMEDWEDGYREFLESTTNYRNNFKYNVDPLKYFLFDLDNDGIPELIIHTIDNEDFGYNIYTYSNSKVKRIHSELTMKNENNFALSKDNRLFKLSKSSGGIEYTELKKYRNRILFDEVALSIIDRNGEESFKDGEGRTIDRARYLELTDIMDFKAYMMKDIDEGLMDYEKLSKGTIDMKLNGESLPKDTAVINKEGSTYYPFRSLIEGLGGKVRWDEERRLATGDLDEKKIVFPVDLGVYTLDGVEKELPDERLTFLYQDRTYIPIRDIMEDLGFKVLWDKKDKSIELIK